MKRHLIIAGTGRAGTSFLVQYLTQCGLQTHITKYPGDRLDEHANAGLEDLPVEGADLPYVIKTPWLYEFVDRLLDRSDVVIDAVVLPMRDIVEAAVSRVTLEIRSRLGHPALDEEHTRWETWATTPGGMIYSLNPIDQARILAMGFHQVVHACVKRQIPIVFLDFPRLIDDADYLYEQLSPVFGSSVARELALDAHRLIARKDLVRVGSEIGVGSQPPEMGATIRFPSYADMDRATLYRELKRVSRDAADADVRCMTLGESMHLMEGKCAERARQLSEAQTALANVESVLSAERSRNAAATIAANDSLCVLRAALDEEGRKLNATLASNTASILAAEHSLNDLRKALDQERRKVAEMRASTSWKIAALIRHIKRLIKTKG